MKRALAILLFAFLSLGAFGQTYLTSSEVVVNPANDNGNGVTIGAFWGNSLNTSNPTGSMLFTDTDGSHWVAYARMATYQAYTSNPQMRIAHITAGGVVTISNPSLSWSTTDQHNAATIALDKNGYIWVCYDQHVSALNCYKSNAVRNATAFTSAGTLVNAAVEASVTFPLLFTNPANQELYLTFQKGGGAYGQQYFYHYKYGSTSWEGAPGTSTNGQLANYYDTGQAQLVNQFFNGLPQWDKTTGYLWFSYILSDDVAPGWNCGSPNYACAQYVVGWTGSAFIKVSGATQTLPLDFPNTTPVYTMHAGIGPSVTPLNSVSIDSNEVLWTPWLDVDASGYLQVYVVGVNLATGAVGSLKTLTSNAAAFSPPGGAGWLGPGAPNNCGNAPYSCGIYVQSVTAISSGSCTYVTYADIFNWNNGQVAYKSCDGFATNTVVYLTPRFNPNIIIFPDQVANYKTGAISFLWILSNDTQYRFSTVLDQNTVDSGKLVMITIGTNPVQLNGATWSGLTVN